MVLLVAALAIANTAEAVNRKGIALHGRVCRPGYYGADINHVSVVKWNPPEVSFIIALTPDGARDFVPQDRDTIFVPKIDVQKIADTLLRLRAQTVLICGDVKHPGEYKIDGVSDLQSVLNLAGGASNSDEYITVTYRGKDDFISNERFWLRALKGVKIYPGSIVDIRVGKIEPFESFPAGDFY